MRLDTKQTECRFFELTHPGRPILALGSWHCTSRCAAVRPAVLNRLPWQNVLRSMVS